MLNSKAESAMTSSTDWQHHIYACSDDNSYYAAPVFHKNNNNTTEAPKKLAPSLSRQSTCRPISQLYLPHKKRKETFVFTFTFSKKTDIAQDVCEVAARGERYRSRLPRAAVDENAVDMWQQMLTDHRCRRSLEGVGPPTFQVGRPLFNSIPSFIVPKFES
ncbi:unnamed protein product [Caenorhabditis auriculariae]|uniref:Uncharacterized protein n=1 Tax=Caenorhabditis auriculariae TaxID=2777116 RepID=A0A8S1HE41_9PELO|nr:unnamed protein product [Caenorhabditis auriculariae]